MRVFFFFLVFGSPLSRPQPLFNESVSASHLSEKRRKKNHFLFYN